MQYENVFKGDRCCSCYTCIPQTAPAAQTTQRVVAAPGTGTGAPPVAQRLLLTAVQSRGAERMNTPSFGLAHQHKDGHLSNSKHAVKTKFNKIRWRLRLPQNAAPKIQNILHAHKKKLKTYFWISLSPMAMQDGEDNEEVGPQMARPLV